MSEHNCWKLLMNTWAISLRVHKYGFVLLNRLRTAIDTVFSNPRTANYWKMSKNGVSLKTSLQIHCYIPILNWLYTKPFPKSWPADKRKNLDFIFIGSEVTTQTRLKMAITLRCVIRRNDKNVMIFGLWWFLGLRAFQRYIIWMILHK